MEISGSSLMIELMMTFVVFTPSILLFTRDVIVGTYSTVADGTSPDFGLVMLGEV